MTHEHYGEVCTVRNCGADSRQHRPLRHWTAQEDAELFDTLATLPTHARRAAVTEFARRTDRTITAVQSRYNRIRRGLTTVRDGN